jgi:hypothetical protein
MTTPNCPRCRRPMTLSGWATLVYPARSRPTRDYHQWRCTCGGGFLLTRKDPEERP